MRPTPRGKDATKSSQRGEVSVNVSYERYLGIHSRIFSTSA